MQGRKIGMFARWSEITLGALLLSLSPAMAQTSPTQVPPNLPKTPPQTQSLLTAYEGQSVAAVDLAGQPDLDASQLTPLLQVHAGDKFSVQRANDSVAAIKSNGKFPDVRLRVDPETSGVRVVFILEPADYYGLFTFPGATKTFAYSRLVQVTNYPPRGAFDQRDVDDAAAALTKFFRREGYFQAKVTPKIHTLDQYGLVNVEFATVLGKKAKFGTVTIEGADAKDTAQLEHVAHSFLARIRGAAIRKGKSYRYKTLQNATTYLESKLQNQGHLGATVKLIGAQYDAASNRANISFHVTTGPIYQVKVDGAHFFSRTKRKLLPVYAGIGVDPELIQEGRQNLVGYFENKGYFDAKVTTDTQQRPTGELIEYHIVKGPRHKVEEVSVAGNHKIPAKELLDSVKVKEASFFAFLNHGDFNQKLVNASAKNIENIYKAAGYSTVKVTPQVKKSGGNIDVTFNVDEGPRDVVDAMNVEGTTIPETMYAPEGLKIGPGKPYSQQLADTDRNNIMANYLRMGYLTASFRETVKAVPKQPHHIDVVYTISEGPRVETENIITLGRKQTKQRLINNDMEGISSNSPLTEQALLTSQTELYKDEIFDWAEIDTRREITTQTKEDVVVKLHEAARNELTYGFGFEVIKRGGSVPSGTLAVPGIPPVGLRKNFRTAIQTFYGPRGSIAYTRTNLRGKAESFSVNAFAGRLDQRVAAVYTNPYFRWSKWQSDVQTSFETNQENPVFSIRQEIAGYELKRNLDAKKTKNFFLRYNYTDTSITRLVIPQLVPEADRHTRLSTVSANYVRDTRDNPLDAHKGIYETFELGITPTALGSSVNFARFFAQTAYYKKVFGDTIWANSVRLGLEQPFAGSHVPISQEFFTGGGSTLRGFPLDGAGPQRVIQICSTGNTNCYLTQVSVGGNELLIINSELRIPLAALKQGLGIVPFYDGGDVYPRVGFHTFATTYTNSIGVGFRYATPVGPVRIDIGHTLDPLPAIPGVPGVKATNFFITIGQAF